MIRTKPLTRRRAQELFNKLESDPTNPKWTEVHMRAGRVLKDGEHRITPHFSFEESEDGTVALGMLETDWVADRCKSETDYNTLIFSVDEFGDTWIERRQRVQVVVAERLSR